MEKTRILVVEDEMVVAADMCGMLEQLGYAVAENVISGEEALEYMGRERVDLVLMDVRLSGTLDGVQTAEKIGARWQVPIVFLTAYEDEETLQRARQSGSYGYLLKPFHVRELRSMIETAIYRYTLERRLKEAYDLVEQRVFERTAELLLANRQLEREIDERVRAERELRTARDQLREKTRTLLRINKDIKRLNRRLEHTEQELKEFSRGILLAREDEKRRFANDLHDEVGAMVVALNSGLSVADTALGEGDVADARDAIGRTRKLLKEAVDNLKGLAIRMRPPNLDIIGLPEALRQYCDQFGRATGIPIDFDASLDESLSIDESSSITFYRVVQEALNNVVKHADASAVSIRLYRRDDEVRFEITDNGKGFPLSALTRSGHGFHMGIVGMRERIEAIGGAFTISSEPGVGTRVSATLAL